MQPFVEKVTRSQFSAADGYLYDIMHNIPADKFKAEIIAWIEDPRTRIVRMNAYSLCGFILSRNPEVMCMPRAMYEEAIKCNLIEIATEEDKQKQNN